MYSSASLSPNNGRSSRKYSQQLTREHLVTTDSRERWNNRAEFVLILVGYTIGLGNVWRFPYLCHKNGGASFLIPYGVMLAIVGIPLYYLELCLGQRMRKGSIGVWNEISPYLGGVGFSSVVVCFLVSLYYNVIIAWCVFYFVNSFQEPLPWASCPTVEYRSGNATMRRSVPECARSDPTTYFWYRTALDSSSGIEDSGTINLKMVGCLAGTWLVVWLCMMKGIKVTGKIVYFTATTPLVLLIILFFRGVHLNGYQEGLALLFIPEFDKLKDPLVWMDAATQIFYSLGVAYGSLIAFASYNPIKSECTRDAITVCLVNCGVSVYASVVVFCFIGFQAQGKMEACEGRQLEQVINLMNGTRWVNGNMLTVDYPAVKDAAFFSQLKNVSTAVNQTLIECKKSVFLSEISPGRALAFLVFTEAINKLPLPAVWSVMFFFMLIMVGIDTEFGMLEGVVTPIIDMKIFPNVRKEVLSGVICLVSFLFAATTVLSSGEYWLQFIDSHCSGIPLLVIGLVEVLAISYVYGVDRFSDDITYMTNKPPRFIWKWCWKGISPLAILVILVMSIQGMTKNPPSYLVWDKDQGKTRYEPYPPWLVVLIVLINLSSIIFIPGIALLNYFGWMKIRRKGSIVLLPNKTKRRCQHIRMANLKPTTGGPRLDTEQSNNGNCQTLITNGDTA